MRRLLLIFGPIGVIVLTVFTVIALSASRPEPEKSEPDERPVSVFIETAKRVDIVPRVTTQGEVRARTEINLVPQVSGRIVATAPSFVEGGIFSANETLIQIEDDDYTLAVTRAEARVAEARQALIREEAEGEMARRDWEELGQGDASPLTLREPQMAQARASLAAAEADLQGAKLDLQRTRISVPFDGRVRDISANLGQFVSPGTPLGRVFSTDLVEIRLPLTDRELGILGLPIGYAASEEDAPVIELTAVVGGELHSWDAKIKRTDSAIDPDTRLLFAIAEVQDPYGVGADGGAPLAVGLFVTAEIPGRAIEDALVIPRAALRSSDQVLVVDSDDRLDIRRVDIAFTETDRVVLNGGVEPGDRVIVSPLQGPVQGLKLNAIPRGQSAALSGGEGSGDAS